MIRRFWYEWPVDCIKGTYMQCFPHDSAHTINKNSNTFHHSVFISVFINYIRSFSSLMDNNMSIKFIHLLQGSSLHLQSFHHSCCCQWRQRSLRFLWRHWLHDQSQAPCQKATPSRCLDWCDGRPCRRILWNRIQLLPASLSQACSNLQTKALT